MNQLKLTLRLFFLLLVLSMFSCSGSQQNKTDENTITQAAPNEKVEINPETQNLLDQLVKMGDYANSREIPSLINPSSLYEQLDSNILIVDIRRPDIFVNGHIKGAKNVQFSDLNSYFKNDINKANEEFVSDLRSVG